MKGCIIARVYRCFKVGHGGSVKRDQPCACFISLMYVIGLSKIVGRENEDAQLLLAFDRLMLLFNLYRTGTRKKLLKL